MYPKWKFSRYPLNDGTPGSSFLHQILIYLYQIVQKNAINKGKVQKTVFENSNIAKYGRILKSTILIYSSKKYGGVAPNQRQFCIASKSSKIDGAPN